MIELLRESAGRDQSAVAVITDSAQVTYGALLAAAESGAAGLTKRGIDRFGIVLQDAAVVIGLLAAASLAGAEACVYPPLDQPGDAGETSARFDHRVIVSDHEDLEVAAEVMPPSELAAAGGAPPDEPPTQRPLLVLTTGTTGEPRGAIHDWGRILRAVARIRPAPGSRWLFAYGLQQFGGLQILIHVTAAGATLVAPFPRRPREGLAAMRDHSVTHASATPTFWRFLLAEMLSDGGEVPGLQQITLGGEAVPEALLHDLKATFPTARISQIYGANEFGQNISVRDREIGLPTSALGNEEADVAFKVVDGELWVRSRVGMLGYYGHDPIDSDEWRPTGDLVEIDADRVMFRGRVSDVINVGGVKVHPLPVEERVLGVPGVVLCRVVGRPNPLTGHIVAVEVEAADDADTEELEQAIRDACSTLPAATRPRSIQFVEHIPVQGQKVERRAHA